MCKLLGNVLRENGIAQQADIITSVPMHKSKRRKRGYDQAQKLAHFTAMELGIKENYRLLGQAVRNISPPHEFFVERQSKYAVLRYPLSVQADDSSLLYQAP